MVHIVLGKMSKFYTYKTSLYSVSLPCVMFYSIFSNILILTIIVRSVPCVVIPTKYIFDNLFCWVPFLGLACWRFVPLFFAIVTLSFKHRFLYAFTYYMSWFFATITLFTKLWFNIAPTLVWCMSYLSTIITCRPFVLLSFLLIWFTFFYVS